MAVAKAAGKINGKPTGIAGKALKYISKLYKIEKEANGLEPYWYLKYLFENLPEAMTANEFKALMPQNVDKYLLESNYTTHRQA